MKNLLAALLTILTFSSYAQTYVLKPVETHIDASFRGLSVVNDSVAWLSGTKGYIGLSTNAGKGWNFTQVKGFEKSDFRSLYAFDAQNAIIANAGSPANILITKDGGKNWKVVYTNSDSATFFDGIAFWNEKEGIIYGDPVNNHMLLLSTQDGGNTWQLLPDNSRPLLEKGESSFAASGTGIRCYENNKVVISTGGKVSRLFVSSDKGKNWKVSDTPIIQFKSSAGIFSSIFFNNKKGVIVGGDYTKDTLKTDHVFYTKDNGKTWLKPSVPTRGYRECVEYLDNGKLIAVGPTGIDISEDDGVNWKALSDEKGFHVIKGSPKGNLVIFAGGKGKVALLKKINR